MSTSWSPRAWWRSLAQGADHHRAAEEEIGTALEREGAPAPVVSSAGALIDALAEPGARRVAMVTPYEKPLTRLVAEYIEASGTEVHDAIGLEVTDNRAVAELDPAGLRDRWRALDLSGCDALIVSAFVQMRSLAVIEDVDRDSGLPTLSAAAATAWAMLRALGLEPTAPAAGRLLAGREAGHPVVQP